MKLLLDEHISGKVADLLRGRGHDALAVSGDPHLRGRSDAGLFELAQRQGHAVVTYDRSDFESVIREYAGNAREHHGLVLVHSKRFPGKDAARLGNALAFLLERPGPGRSFVVWLQEPK